jgi:hypothetical protein
MRYFSILLLLVLFQSVNAQIIDSFPMPPLKFDPNGGLIITASPTSSQHDFDFFVGKWKMKNRHLNARLANCKDPQRPRWSQAFSDDNGKTWEWNYTNTSYKVN